MSDTPNGSHDSIDTSPLTLDQLSNDELYVIVSIEHQLGMKQSRASKGEEATKPYLAPIQVRRPRVLLLDGARGTGKTSLLLTMAHRWNIYDGCETKRHDEDPTEHRRRIEEIQDRLPFTHGGTLPKHLHPLRILDFDPLPPQMPLIAGIIQAWQPLAKKYDELSGQTVECDDAGETLQDRWENLFRVATVGWSALPAARGLLEQVLDRQEQVTEWQSLGQQWYRFVSEVTQCGRCLKGADRLVDDSVFVIMVDDVDLQVERIRELLPALRLLYHPNVAFLVAAHWEHLLDTLKTDFLGQQNRLARCKVVGSALSAAARDKWAGTLATSAATKVFRRKNRWTLTKLALRELLAFSDSEYDAATPRGGDASTLTTMRTMLNKWPREAENGVKLGEYLSRMAGTQGEPNEISPFIAYREAQQIFESALMQRDSEAGAREVVRCLLSDSESEAVTLEGAEEGEPIVEYRGVGQLAALFRSDHVEPIAALSGIVLGASPDFIYRKEPSSDAISMRGYVGAEVNFTTAMLAATIQDALYGVAAPGLQWNVGLALAWTRVRVLDKSAFVNLSFQWRFHEHPHPFQLLEWSREWRAFIRTLQVSSAQRLERIAYAWIFYQLKWLGAGMAGVLTPSQVKVIRSRQWKKLLTVTPRKRDDWERELWRTQDWRTQTLPLLARPEIGLPPTVQRQLLGFGESDADADRSVLEMPHEWLRDQRRRLVTDAIIAAGEEEGGRAEDAENTERVEGIVTQLEAQHRAAHGSDSPWQVTVEALSRTEINERAVDGPEAKRA